MDKFLQQLRDNLEKEPQPDFDQRDWKDMQQRLHPPTEKPRRRLAGFWSMAALMLLFIGMNGFTYYQLQQSNGKVQALEQKLDTLIKAQIIYQTDTIYIDRIVIENTQNTQNAQSEQILSNQQSTVIYQSNKKFANLFQQDLLTHFNKNSPFFDQNKQPTIRFFQQKIQSPFLDYQREQLAQELVKRATLEAAVRSRPIAKLALMDIPNLSLPNPDFSTVTLPILENKPKKSTRQILYAFRPKGLEIGATGGMIMLGEEQLGNVNFGGAGLVANVKFSDNLQMWLGGFYRQFGYHSEGMGEKYGIPTIPFPSIDYKFEGANVVRNGWQAEVGMEYIFNAQKKWQPFFGAGFSMVSLFKNEINYKFEEEITDEYFQETLVLDTPNVQNFIVVKGGLRYQFTDKWSARLAAAYYHDFDNSSNQIPNNFGLRAGVFYDF